MSLYDGTYPANCAQEKALNAGAATQYVPPTLKRQLEQQKQHLETQLANVNSALNALEKNPEFENVVNALAKVGIR